MRFNPFAAAALAAILMLPVQPSLAAIVVGTENSDLLVGADDDNLNDPEIQPPGTTANQTLNNADLMDGKGGHDVLIGLLGSDTLIGGPGDDVLVGGTEQAQAPNSDIQLGGTGNDTAVWAGGDGSDLFDGGPGQEDALVFGTIDKVNGIPTISAATGKYRRPGLPTADVTNQGAFCQIQRVLDPVERGYDFLIRFVGRANRNLIVTIRTKDVEQVFCTSEAGGSITYADLTVADPQFVDVSLDEVEQINRTVRAIIR